MGPFLRQLWPFVRTHRSRLLAGVGAGLLDALGSGMLMLSVKRVFDAAFPTAGARSIEQGTHAGLLAREGAYARLHALQFGDA